MSKLTPSKSPVLPIPDGDYSQLYFDQLLNYLKLYFAKIDLNSSELLGTLGGGYLSSPYCNFFSDANQTTSLTNTPTQLDFDQVGDTNGMSLSPVSTVTVNVAGLYRLGATLQFTNSDTVRHTVQVFARVNGVDVARSSSRHDVGADTSVSTDLQLMLAVGDAVTLWWSTPSLLVSLEASPAVGSPATSSVTINSTFVSNR